MATRLFSTTALCGAVALVVPVLGKANPVGGVVAAGAASIASPQVGKLEIRQATDKAVIDWRSFNIGVNEHTEFKQPSKTSHTLNRVNANDPSQILGKLSANGKVTLVNPNGVFFGKTSTVDVNGLIATTADISNKDFMAGKLKFDKPGNPDAAIVNEGRITAREAGLVGLVAPNVLNSGVIQAKTVQLASGDTALDLYGDGLLSITVSDKVKQQVVANTGVIVAGDAANNTGGTIAITAAAAREAINSLVIVEGELHAPVINNTGGRIIIENKSKDAASNLNNKVITTNGVLQAGSIDILNTDKNGKANGVVAVSGIVKAEMLQGLGSRGLGLERKKEFSNPKTQNPNPSYTTGGTIRISGKTTMVNNAILDVSGTDGGGNLRLGGEYLGGKTEVPLPGKFVKNLKTPNATTTIVGENTLLIADATERGNGGNMVTWADGYTSFHGNIFARGGEQDTKRGGNGGFVEVSGKGTLDFQAQTVDLKARYGEKGTLLLDPTDIVISNFAPNDASIAANLKLWLDASDASTVTLAYDTDGLSSATASGTSGSNTITTSANVASSLAVGARIRLTAAGTTTTANTLGTNTYTIASISGTTITTVEALTVNYTTQALYRGLVSSWADKSTSGFTASQSSVNRRALYTSNGIGGLGSIDFTGYRFYTLGSDYIYSSGTGLTALGVLKSNGNGGNDFFYDFGSFANNGYGIRYAGTGTIGLHTPTNAGGSINSITANNINTAVFIANIKFNASQKFFLNQDLVIDDPIPGLNNLSSGNINNGGNPVTIGAQSKSYQQSTRHLEGLMSQTLIYNTSLSDNAQTLLNQYQSAKYNIALTVPGTGADEAAKATSATGYSVFHKGYLERLSQSANIALVADNSITINDLTANGGDGILNLAAGRSLSLSTTTGNITMVNTANTLRTSGGGINITAGGNLTLGRLDTTGNGSNATGAAISLTGTSLNLNGSLNAGTSSLLANSTTGNLTTAAASALSGAALFKSANNLTISSGDLTATGNNPLTFLAKGDIAFLSSVQHGGSGAVNVVAGWDGTTEASATPTTFNMANILAQPVATTTIYGNDNDGVGVNTGSVFVTAASTQAVAVGSRTGNTNIAGKDLSVKGGSVLYHGARIGINNDVQTASGDIALKLKGDLSLLAGTANSTESQIGHGEYFSSGNRSGIIDIVAQDINITGNTAFASLAQIGHGGYGQSGDMGVTTDTISIIANNLTLTSGSGQDAYAIIGNGGNFKVGNHKGNILISLNNDLKLISNGTGIRTRTQIGHGGVGSNGNHGALTNLISINANNITLLAGGGTGSYSQIGFGSASNPSTGTRQGNIIINALGEISIVDNGSFPSYIGHKTTSGTITNANIRIKANSLDFADDTPNNSFLLTDTNFVNSISQNLAGGAVTLINTNTGGGGGFSIGPNITSTTGNRLALISARTLGITGTINMGSGQFVGIGGWEVGTGLNSDGSINLNTLATANRGTSSNIIVGSLGSISSTGTGNAIILAAEDNFTNNNTAPASSVLNTPNGRYVLYTRDRVNNTLNNLNPTKQIGVSYGDNIVAYSAGNYLFYVTASGSIRLVPVSQTYTYNGNSQFSNVFGTGYAVNSADIAELTTDGYSTTDFNNSLSVGLGFNIDGVASGSSNTTSAFSISKAISLTGSLTSSLGYTVALDNSATGNYLINPKAITGIGGITGINKTYDSLTTASLNTGSATFNGIIGGDVLSVASSTGTFAAKNAGTGKTVSISGLSLGGASASNYTLTNTTASTLADIIAKAISSITGITGISKVYDGNSSASVNTSSLTYNGIIGGDTLGK